MSEEASARVSQRKMQAAVQSQVTGAQASQSWSRLEMVRVELWW